jgi:WD40 repeat protein
VAVSDADDSKPLVATGSYDGSVCIWELDASLSSCAYTQISFHGKPGVSSVLVSAEEITSAGWDGVVASWDTRGRLRQAIDVEAAYHAARARA